MVESRRDGVPAVLLLPVTSRTNLAPDEIPEERATPMRLPDAILSAKKWERFQGVDNETGGRHADR